MSKCSIINILAMLYSVYYVVTDMLYQLAFLIIHHSLPKYKDILN